MVRLGPNLHIVLEKIGNGVLMVKLRRRRMSSANIVTVIPGEASETDDDDDNSDCNGSNKNSIICQNDQQMRNWDLNEAQQRSWSSHVDEKLEERWRSLGYDTVKLAERQVLTQRKQFENLKQNICNTQHAIQVLLQSLSSLHLVKNKDLVLSRF
uniref:Biogenesis of lysosome-related organelles complex 1 subunit 3 n=1 Tax=Setaria digitata TaxID=48799 RepID=A0A915Q408_9BILA